MGNHLHDPLSLLLIFLLTLLAAVLMLFALLLLQRAVGILWARHAQRRETALTPLLLAALTKPSAVPSAARRTRKPRVAPSAIRTFTGAPSAGDSPASTTMNNRIAPLRIGESPQAHRARCVLPGRNAQRGVTIETG